jgi:hypothetical protein
MAGTLTDGFRASADARPARHAAAGPSAGYFLAGS